MLPKGKPGIVAKIRKIAPTVSPTKRVETLANGAWDLRRDLAMEVVADRATARGLYVDDGGEAVPLLIDGKPADLDAPPSKRLARVAKVTNEELLAQGIVEQELVRFSASKALKTMLKEPRDKADGWRRKAIALAEASTRVSVKDTAGFLDRYYKASKFGPDVIKIRGWFDGCRKLAGLAPIADLCRLARHAYNVPDDFDDRLRALEQLYRDTAADVIRFHRHNFYDASGNDAGDGFVREVGLDFNHGRNAGWDPHTGQFALFDW